MSRIFLSHSSRNNAEALALRDWLVSLGYDDIFLDLEQIQVGDRWRKALVESMDRCKAVVFLVSRHWLDSRECYLEFAKARDENKSLFLLIIDDTQLGDLPTEYTANYQVASLRAGSDFTQISVQPPPDFKQTAVSFSKEGLRSLQLGLGTTGLASQATESFPWPPENDAERVPYRGLKALDVADAGVFFGRDAQLIRGMEALEDLRQSGGRRLFVVLGTSGAGKSSFLRAGLWPRLKRESHKFNPLPVFRADRGALWGESGLLAILERATKAAGLIATRSELRKDIETGSAGVLKRFEAIHLAGRDGMDAADRAPTLVLPVDQAEELFPADPDFKQEAEQFLTIMADALAHGPEMIAAATIRSDRYAPLQRAHKLETISQVPFNLPPMSQADFRAVIEGPARRATDAGLPLIVEAELTERLIHDAHGADALPLLSFTLERLFDEHGADGDLLLSEYEDLGGIEGSILAAAEAAFANPASPPAIPSDPRQRDAQLKSAFIPHLMDINEENDQPLRRIARLSEVPADARPIVERLVNSRLLVSAANAESGSDPTVEVAHEALLRQWPTLQPWLEEARDALKVKQGVQRAAADWERDGRREGDLIHSGERLQAAQALFVRQGFGEQLAGTPADYVRACKERETEQRNRDSRRRRVIQGLSVATIILLSVAVIGTTWFLSRTQQLLETARDAEATARSALDAEREAQGEVRKSQRLQSRLLVIAQNRENPPIPFDVDVLAARYEGQSSDHIESDTQGRWYYGIFRIQSGANLQEFLEFLRIDRSKFENGPEYIRTLVMAGGIDAGNAGDEAFRSAWKSLANGPETAIEFADLQTVFIEQRGDYKRLRERLSRDPDIGIDLSERSAALSAVMFSVAVQYGPATPLIDAAFVGDRAPSELSDRQIIDRIYSERDKVTTYFPDFAQDNFVDAFRIRNEWEKRDALYLLENS